MRDHVSCLYKAACSKYILVYRYVNIYVREFGGSQESGHDKMKSEMQRKLWQTFCIILVCVEDASAICSKQ